MSDDPSADHQGGPSDVPDLMAALRKSLEAEGPNQMKTYAAHAMGWLWVGQALNARDALQDAREAASSASLLRSDVTAVRRATDEEIIWWEAMQ